MWLQSYFILLFLNSLPIEFWRWYPMYPCEKAPHTSNGNNTFEHQIFELLQLMQQFTSLRTITMNNGYCMVFFYEINYIFNYLAVALQFLSFYLQFFSLGYNWNTLPPNANTIFINKPSATLSFNLYNNIKSSIFLYYPLIQFLSTTAIS